MKAHEVNACQRLTLDTAAQTAPADAARNRIKRTGTESRNAPKSRFAPKYAAASRSVPASRTGRLLAHAAMAEKRLIERLSPQLALIVMRER
jgi:hypothetical protein